MTGEEIIVTFKEPWYNDSRTMSKIATELEAKTMGGDSLGN